MRITEAPLPLSARRTHHGLYLGGRKAFVVVVGLLTVHCSPTPSSSPADTGASEAGAADSSGGYVLADDAQLADEIGGLDATAADLADTAADGSVSDDGAASETAVGTDVIDVATGDSDAAETIATHDCAEGAEKAGCPCSLDGDWCCISFHGLVCTGPKGMNSKPLKWEISEDCCVPPVANCGYFDPPTKPYTQCKPGK